MKKLFSNKSGFSLAEIIIAIAVFSIMLAMIMQMLRLSIDQRNQNYKYAQRIDAEEEALVLNGKDTTIPDDPSDPDHSSLPALYLDFEDKDGKTLFKTSDTSTPDGLSIKYQIKGNGVGSDVNDGLNYFVGDFDYSADGVGGAGGDGAGGSGVGQTDRYDTRITGTKGLKNITISECSKVSTIPDYKGTITDFSPYTIYKMTVKADSSGMQEDDRKYSQMRFYFYSSDEYDIKKVSTPKLGADGKPVMKPDGKTPETDDYYKKVYKKSEIVEVVSAKSNIYTVEKGSSNAVRVGLPLNGGGSNNSGFESSKSTTFYIVFKKDPNISATSFGEGGSSVYNRADIYDEKDGSDTGKDHVNIYGALKYDTHAKKKTSSKEVAI